MRAASAQPLLLIAAFHYPVFNLGMVPRKPTGKNQKQDSQRIFLADEGWKSSSAITSIEDRQRIQEILKNRQSRRKPRIDASPPFLETSDYDDDENDYEMDSPWISLPSRPKRNTIIQSRNTTTRQRVSSNGLHIPFKTTLQALQAFHEEHSHLVIPRRYRVPESCSYPSIWHGLDLAGTVYTMKWWQRHVQNQPDRVSELNNMGFIWERVSALSFCFRFEPNGPDVAP